MPRQRYSYRRINVTMTKIIPRNKYVLVKPDLPHSTESESGLILPANTEEEKKSQGIVEAVSKEITDIKKGDRVIYGTFAGEVVKMKPKKGGKEEEWHLVHTDDIIAFLQ